MPAVNTSVLPSAVPFSNARDHFLLGHRSNLVAADRHVPLCG